MSTDSDHSDRRTAVQHAQEDQRQRDRRELRDHIKTTIERCSRAWARGGRQREAWVATTLRDELLPALDRYADRSWMDYDDLLRGHDYWDGVAFTDFIEHADALVRALTVAADGPSGHRARGLDVGRPKARLTTKKALEAVNAIAEEENIVQRDFAGRVDAVGLTGTIKLGEQLRDETMDAFGDPVRVITEESGAVKTLFTGGTGQGKSLSLEREAEDLYLQNFREGRDIKVIDIVGTGDGENWFYDVPQNDQELQTARDEMGLPATFESTDYTDRRVRILHPLTPGLSRENLPYDEARGEFIVEPFAVPASQIRKPLLISMLTAKLTPQQEAIVRDAYDEVNRGGRDWALRDLADEVRSRDELPPDKKKPVVRTLRQLQNQGFIRTQEDAHTIDWQEVFTSTEEVTIFSQAFVDSDQGSGDVIAKLLSIGYVVDSLVKKRESMRRVPKCALLMRELWTVAPHNRRQKFDQRAAQLQEAIGHMLSELFRVNRRRGVHILADTQQPSDLLKPVREMFNRYVIFRTNRDTVKDIFDWTANDQWRSFYHTLTPRPGTASIVGMVEPALDEDNRNIEFVGPVEYAPPGHHHFDEDHDFAGWYSRVEYLDDEELRRPADVDGVDWPDEVPTKLEITFDAVAEDSAPDPVTNPVGAFADECLTYQRDTGTPKERVKVAFNEWVVDARGDDEEGWEFGDRAVDIRFGKQLKQCLDEDDATERTTINGQSAFKHLALTSRGEQYYEAAMEGLEDASEPIL